MREIRTLRSTWRGLETWHGRDSVTLANERARNREYNLRPKPARQSSTLPVRGSGCNSPGLLGSAPAFSRYSGSTHPLFKKTPAIQLHGSLQILNTQTFAIFALRVGTTRNSVHRASAGSWPSCHSAGPQSSAGSSARAPGAALVHEQWSSSGSRHA